MSAPLAKEIIRSKSLFTGRFLFDHQILASRFQTNQKREYFGLLVYHT
jgi:hypothetical protein